MADTKIINFLKNEAGKRIVVDDGSLNCFKCGKEIKDKSWGYYCEINKKVFCDSPECKSKSCSYNYVRDYHEDHYAPLTLVSKKLK